MQPIHCSFCRSPYYLNFQVISIHNFHYKTHKCMHFSRFVYWGSIQMYEMFARLQTSYLWFTKWFGNCCKLLAIELRVSYRQCFIPTNTVFLHVLLNENYYLNSLWGTGIHLSPNYHLSSLQIFPSIFLTTHTDQSSSVTPSESFTDYHRGSTFFKPVI